MISRRSLLLSAAGAAVSWPGARLFPSAQAATAYPAQPVRWVVPYTAGGATDVLVALDLPIFVGSVGPAVHR